MPGNYVLAPLFVSYGDAAAQANLAATLTKMQFRTIAVNNGFTLNGGNDRLTITKSGWYLLTGRAFTSTASVDCNIQVFKNGSTTRAMEFRVVTNSTLIMGQDYVYLVAGDYVEMFISSALANNWTLVSFSMELIR